MPFKAKKVCSYSNCNELTDSRFCVNHKKTDNRKEDHSKLYTRQWRRVRVGYLRKHPICVECEKEKRYTPATEVDHIIPHKGDRAIFWDAKNWQSLCKPCHSRKTMRENKEAGKM